MRSDFHLHSSFSADSDAPMRDMVEKGISLGLSAMCFTEHMDYDYIAPGTIGGAGPFAFAGQALHPCGKRKCRDGSRHFCGVRQSTCS